MDRIRRKLDHTKSKGILFIAVVWVCSLVAWFTSILFIEDAIWIRRISVVLFLALTFDPWKRLIQHFSRNSFRTDNQLADHALEAVLWTSIASVLLLMGTYFDGL